MTEPPASPPASMKAAAHTRYGGPDVIRIRRAHKPVPGPGDVLVRVHTSTVNRTDAAYLSPHPFFIRAFSGLWRPKHRVRGMDFAGVVESVGAEVTAFEAGDRVFGLGPNASGGHAEYLCVPAKSTIAKIPPGIGFAEAVVCEGALYANSCLQAFGVEPGSKLLVYGASGAIGTAAVQLAKLYGAEVTALVATRHLEMAQSIGADHVVDYTTEDFTKIGRTFDFVLDAVGKSSYFQCKPLLAPDGVFAATDLGPWYSNVFLPLWGSITRRRRVIFPFPKGGQEFIEFVAERLAAGELRAVIDRTYDLEDVAEGFRYVLTGEKTGIVVVNVAEAGAAGARTEA